MIFEVASLIAVNLLIAGIIGFIAGYLVAKASNPKILAIDCMTNQDEEVVNETRTRTQINPIFRKSSHLDFKPLVLSFPKSTGKDDLKKIKGISSKVENDLNNLGIYHFEQIAKWTNKNCDWIEEFLMIPGCAKNNQWVDQAKILQTGKETVYSQRILDGEIVVD